MRPFTPSSTDLRNMIKAAESKFDGSRYAARAKAAYAAAEAATDPRDKEAFRAAAKTWERLAKPAKDTYSLEPLRRDLAALKRDIASAIDAPASAPAVTEVIEASAHGMARRFSVNKTPVAIEF